MAERVIRRAGEAVSFARAPVNLLRLFAVHHRLVYQFAKRGVQARYRGSVMGILWSFITPLLMLAIYTFVFTQVFKATGALGRYAGRADFDAVAYALFLFCGLVPYYFFCECLGGATTLITGQPNYVKRVVFPLEILPAAHAVSATVHLLFGLVIVELGVWVLNGSPSPTTAWTLVAVVPLLLWGHAGAMFLSSLGVFVRDLAAAVGVILTALLFVSPIMFPVEAVPKRFQLVMDLNPLTPVLENCRRTLWLGDMPAWREWIASTVIAFVFAELATVWFLKSKRAFADVV
jgi:lipopolysaccharide transport system permease protein